MKSNKKYREAGASITLLGMSGVGKTRLAKLLGSTGAWFHYSGDFRIGTAYLASEIVDYFERKLREESPWADAMLRAEAININARITFDNLSSLSAYLGKVGNPDECGLPLDIFLQRQRRFSRAEALAMGDVPTFIERARALGYANFINDAGGSLCEIDDQALLSLLFEHTRIVYIKADDNDIATLIERACKNPKPLYYNETFLRESLATYMNENDHSYIAEIAPNAFIKWVFPKLFKNRTGKYQALADKYGCSISARSLKACITAEEALALIQEKL